MQRKPVQIVVVDDDEFLILLYESAIQNWPFKTELTCFTNGDEAIKHLAENSPNMLIVDWEMPILSGAQLLTALYGMFDMEKTTTVVVSSVEASDILAHPALPRSVEVLPKPIPFNRLQHIAQHLYTRQVSATRLSHDF
jgi:CheY-like chemotaxis protein